MPRAPRHPGRGARVLAAVFAFLVLASLAAAAVLFFNPFSVAPSVSISSAELELGEWGWTAVVNISTTAPVKVVYAEAGGRVVEVVRAVKPPYTVVRIPLPSKADSVALLFDAAPRAEAPLRERPAELSARFLASQGYIFLVGSVPQAGEAYIAPSRGGRVAFVLPPGVKELVNTTPLYAPLRQYLGHIDLYEAGLVGLAVLSNYTTVVFVEILPSQQVFSALRGSGAAVVSAIGAGGAWRYTASANQSTGALVLSPASPGDAAAVFGGASCLVARETQASSSPDPAVDLAIRVHGTVYSRSALSPVEACKRYVDVVVSSDDGFPVLFRVTQGRYQGLYVAPAPALGHVALLAVMAFFEGGGVYRASVEPFKGLRPLMRIPDPVREGGGFVALLVPPGYREFVRILRVEYTTGGGGYAVFVRGPGEGVLGVSRVSYSAELLSFEERAVKAPASLDLPGGSAYILELGGASALIVDEGPAASPPQVTAEASDVCEFFYLEVRGGPGYLYYNGEFRGVLSGSARLGPPEGCGRYGVEVYDLYGRRAFSRYGDAPHIYHQPLFVVGLLLSSLLGAGAAAAAMRRGRREPVEFTGVFYEVPELGGRRLSLEELDSLYRALYVPKRVAPTLEELYSSAARAGVEPYELYRVLVEACRSGRYTVYSRYLAEVGDVVSVLVARGSDPRAEFYKRAVVEVAKLLYASASFGPEVSEVAGVDGALQVDDRIVLLVLATSDSGPELRKALNRALEAFARLRAVQLPKRVAGFAIVAEAGAAEVLNTAVDRLLVQGDTHYAEEVLADMRVLYELAKGEPVLGDHVVAAVPVWRLAPLISLVAEGRYRECNAYYRSLPRFTPVPKK